MLSFCYHVSVAPLPCEICRCYC